MLAIDREALTSPSCLGCFSERPSFVFTRFYGILRSGHVTLKPKVSIRVQEWQSEGDDIKGGAKAEIYRPKNG